MLIELMSATTLGTGKPCSRAAVSMIGRTPCGCAGRIKGKARAWRKLTAASGRSAAVADEISDRCSSSSTVRSNSSSVPSSNNTARLICPLRNCGTRLPVSSSVSSSSTLGNCSRTACNSGKASAFDALCGTPNTTLPLGSPATFITLARASSTCRKIAVACARNTRPASVSSTPRRER